MRAPSAAARSGGSSRRAARLLASRVESPATRCASAPLSRSPPPETMQRRRSEEWSLARMDLNGRRSATA